MLRNAFSAITAQTKAKGMMSVNFRCRYIVDAAYYHTLVSFKSKKVIVFVHERHDKGNGGSYILRCR